jgi:hypothetical protein
MKTRRIGMFIWAATSLLTSGFCFADQDRTCFLLKGSERAQEEFVNRFWKLVDKGICEQVEFGRGDDPKQKVPNKKDKEIITCKVGAASPLSETSEVFTVAAEAFYGATQYDAKAAMITTGCTTGCISWSCPGKDSPCWVKSRRCIQAC